MKQYVRKPVPVRAFKWTGDPKSVTNNVPSQDLHKYFRCFDSIGSPELAVYTFDSDDGWEYPEVGTVIIKSKYGYNLCDPNWFQKLYESK